jgi:hypothetical protein
MLTLRHSGGGRGMWLTIVNIGIVASVPTRNKMLRLNWGEGVATDQLIRRPDPDWAIEDRFLC